MTRTSSFGVGRRENHQASDFYGRGLATVQVSKADKINVPDVSNQCFNHSSESMFELPDDSVALAVTSPPYHVGKDYDSDSDFAEYLGLLERVFRETYRVLQPGGRAVINVANLGRKPYIFLSDEVGRIMVHLGFLPRGEIIWVKGAGSNGSTAWGSWRSPSNPTIRDLHEYLLVFSKGRWDRVVKGQADVSKEEFMETTLSVWNIKPESAKRVGHPAPFPVELPRRLIRFLTYPGEWVLDPFMGSGSTAVAAIETQRNWIGYDTDPAYCEMSRSRAMDATCGRKE